MIDRQYPIGKFSWPKDITPADRAQYIETLATAAARMRAAVEPLSKAQLDTPYRDGGWTARQVIHHLPDSQMNGYIRFKLGLTEDSPVIRPYDEKAWSVLSDVSIVPVQTSINLVAAIHERWVATIPGMKESDWKRQFQHPERGSISLETQLAMYAWHSDHHIAHVRLIAG